jgi:hypothetical protein
VTFDNVAAYRLRKLKDEKKVIVKADRQAQKAVNYILGVRYIEGN